MLLRVLQVHVFLGRAFGWPKFQGRFPFSHGLRVLGVGRILIVDNLRKQHVLIVAWCFMCERSG